jgi:ABC-type cobalamin/Fe3+-siderophores transport system ATPase subunit
MAGMSLHNVSVAGRLQGVTLQVVPGQIVGLIGPNGSGKSTLLHAMAGLLPVQGAVRYEAQDIQQMAPQERARKVGLLPQHCQSAWALRVRDIVRLGRLPWRDDDPVWVEAAMQQAGVQAFAETPIDQLSGGEQARVWLARVLAGCPKVLLADEPVASLDLLYQKHVMEALQAYARKGHIVVVALHDLSLAARYCEQLVFMHQGQIAAQGNLQAVLQPEVLSAVYGLEVMVNLSAQPPVVMAR